MAFAHTVIGVLRPALAWSTDLGVTAEHMPPDSNAGRPTSPDITPER
ncbi:hypothetical protein GCM10022222_35430 [Amycolatopsis ultiminotia]|uniref:Uncharacterized protein n=1 Tax=Amycolatopsis ultiminotia TaxID=543629 RepID=A0ABP6WAU9_9PSEU